MTKLSETAWQKTANIIEAIKAHPFNTELANGSLDLEKFAYYIEQDSMYLREYAKSLALIAARVPTKYAKDFLSFSTSALAEQETLHTFYSTAFNFAESGNITQAALSYVSYLLATASVAPVEVAVASILPCFWVYNEIGLSIAANQNDPDNKYTHWIENYSSEEFTQSVEEVIIIFDQLAQNASQDVRDSMLEAFYTSTVLEWHFWNDAYNQTVFDDI